MAIFIVGQAHLSYHTCMNNYKLRIEFRANRMQPMGSEQTMTRALAHAAIDDRLRRKIGRLEVSGIKDHFERAAIYRPGDRKHSKYIEFN